MRYINLTNFKNINSSSKFGIRTRHVNLTIVSSIYETIKSTRSSAVGVFVPEGNNGMTEKAKSNF